MRQGVKMLKVGGVQLKYNFDFFCSFVRHVSSKSFNNRNSGDIVTTVRDFKKPRGVGFSKQNFVDYIEIRATGGHGGNGCIAFNQIFCNPRAGPGGGDGGNGGHIIAVADDQTVDLSGTSRVILGKSGANGKGSNCHGQSAEHTYLPVPLGTQVTTCDSAYFSRRVLADLLNHGDFHILARGGAGGKGNAFFLSQENRVPRVAESGAVGETVEVAMELKISAAMGMLGFPNAGKSTLLRAVSRARPKVAAYPFTTLRPMVGVVEYEDMDRLTIADLPGLVRGAHKNVGLGHDFLRHLERCRCLLVVVDLSDPDPYEQMCALRDELDLYKKGLSSRSQVIVANKVDVRGAVRGLEELRKKVTGVPVIPVSAKHGINIPEMLGILRRIHEKVLLQEKLVRQRRDESDKPAHISSRRQAALDMLDKL